MMHRRKFLKRASGLLVPATFNLWLPKAHAQLVPPVSALRQHAPSTGGGDTPPDTATASWRFNTGALTTDSVGSSTLTNNGSVAETASGKLNYAADIDANYFSRANAADIQVGANGWSWCGWVYFDSFPTLAGIFCRRFQGDGMCVADIDDYSVLLAGTSLIVRNQNNEASVTWSASVSTGQWYFIAATWDVANSLLKLSVNGATWQTSAANGPVADNGQELWIGRFDSLECGNPVSYYADARFDAFAWWKNYVLTQSNVAYLYNSGTGREL